MHLAKSLSPPTPATSSSPPSSGGPNSRTGTGLFLALRVMLAVQNNLFVTDLQLRISR